jgi:hypothetical protein
MTPYQRKRGAWLAMNKQGRRKYRLFSLCMSQNWKCHYCPRPIIWGDRSPKAPRPDNFATIEHLRDRFHPDRQEPLKRGEQRWVAACNRCNFERGRESQMAQPIEELRRRSQRAPSCEGIAA